MKIRLLFSGANEFIYFFNSDIFKMGYIPTYCWKKERTNRIKLPPAIFPLLRGTSRLAISPHPRLSSNR